MGATIAAAQRLTAESQLIVSGKWYSPAGGRAAQVPVIGRLSCTPFYLPRPQTIAQLAVDVTVGVATAVVRVGVYADAGGIPGALITEYGTLDASAVGQPSAVNSVGVQQGWLWLAAVMQVAGATVDFLTGVSALIGNTAPQPTRELIGYHMDGQNGALPANFALSGVDRQIRIMAQVFG